MCAAATAPPPASSMTTCSSTCSSRGLERDTAQRLLKWAFLADAFARIEVPQLRHQIEEHLAQVLMDRTLQELL